MLLLYQYYQYYPNWTVWNDYSFYGKGPFINCVIWVGGEALSKLLLKSEATWTKSNETIYDSVKQNCILYGNVDLTGNMIQLYNWYFLFLSTCLRLNNMFNEW